MSSLSFGIDHAQSGMESVVFRASTVTILSEDGDASSVEGVLTNEYLTHLSALDALPATTNLAIRAQLLDQIALRLSKVIPRLRFFKGKSYVQAVRAQVRFLVRLAFFTVSSESPGVDHSTIEAFIKTLKAKEGNNMARVLGAISVTGAGLAGLSLQIDSHIASSVAGMIAVATVVTDLLVAESFTDNKKAFIHQYLREQDSASDWLARHFAHHLDYYGLRSGSYLPDVSAFERVDQQKYEATAARLCDKWLDSFWSAPESNIH